ncbi:MAG: CpaF family protein [Gammaproteobacteria bacterium]
MTLVSEERGTYRGSFGSGYSDDNGGDSYKLKATLHRYIIDQMEDNNNLIEGGRAVLGDFVQGHIETYVRRGQIVMSRYEVDQLTEELLDELMGFGPLELLLADQSITEILVNGAQNVFVERDGRLQSVDIRFIDEEHLLRVIQRILAPIGRRLDESSPMVDARLPDGSRVNVVIPPISLDGPCLSIRRFRRDLLKSVDLLAAGSLDTDILEFLNMCVVHRCNILVSGGTGSGKTTMLNLLSSLIKSRERVVTIEDTAELQLGHDHVVRLETRPPNADGHGEVPARNLVRNALRMRPDRIILGEIRGEEVLDLLTAMNTGHDGSMSTVHANTAQDALLRLEALVGLTGAKISDRTLRQTLCSAIDVIIQLTRLPDGRRCVSEILEVVDTREGIYVSNSLFRFDRRRNVFVRDVLSPSNEKFREAIL